MNVTENGGMEENGEENGVLPKGAGGWKTAGWVNRVVKGVKREIFYNVD